jgi:hypothetical protein
MQKIKTISKKEINSIVNQFKDLVKGKSVTVKLPVAKLPPLNLHIHWEEDAHSNAVYDDYPSCVQLSVVHAIIEKAALEQQEIFNIKIKQFINKVIKLENKYSLPKDRLWEDYLWKHC